MNLDLVYKCAFGGEEEEEKRREAKMWARKPGEVMYFSGTNFRGLQSARQGTSLVQCKGIAP